MSRVPWRVLFLGVTGLAIALELFAVLDGNDDTDPWTDLIVRYIPAEVFALGFGGLAIWIAVHFTTRYIRKARNGGKW